MTVIASNVSALRAQNSSAKANAGLSQAMERLSSGKRINSAKDDAAGLAIATKMTSEIRGLSAAISVLLFFWGLTRTPLTQWQMTLTLV